MSSAHIMAISARTARIKKRGCLLSTIVGASVSCVPPKGRIQTTYKSARARIGFPAGENPIARMIAVARRND
jgi:hypothetical protein